MIEHDGSGRPDDDGAHEMSGGGARGWRRPAPARGPSARAYLLIALGEYMLDITAQSMADMINALEGRGLVERRRDPADRRRLVVVLTDGARELLDRYRDEVAALEATMLAGLAKAETLALRRVLYACHANLAGH